MEIQLQTLCAPPNQTVRGFLTVGTTGVELPVIVINGAFPGKTVLLTAGIHGAEYTGIQTLVELAQELSPGVLHGALILLPMTNPTGFRAISPWNVPEDGQNLNRMFPGQTDGSLSQQIAHTVTHTLLPLADFYADLHAGDLYEQLTPYVYYPGAADPQISQQSRSAACVLSVPYRVRSTAVTGSYNSAALRGVPSLLIERGGRGQWSRREIGDYKADLYRLLSHLGLTEDGTAPENTDQQEITEVFYPSAQTDGLWYPAVAAGDFVRPGDPLGEIRDCFGTLLECCTAQAGGVVLYVTATLSIRTGDPTAAYGIPKKD